MDCSRRQLLLASAGLMLGTAASVTLASREAKAFLWLAGIIAEALEGFLVRTVVSGTVRAGITALSEASVARIAASEAAVAARGYATREAFTGLYKGFKLGDLFAEGAGAVGEAIFHALSPGFGVVPGVGNSIGNHQDVGVAEFPNSAQSSQSTPSLGAPDLSSLNTFAKFIQSGHPRWNDNQVACSVYPLEMLEYPEYDDMWNSNRPAVFYSAAGKVRIISVRIGTPEAQCHCQIKPINGSGVFFDEVILLPPALQQPYPR